MRAAACSGRLLRRSGSVSSEKRLDNREDDLGALEESVMVRAVNDGELTVWDRVGDRGR